MSAFLTTAFRVQLVCVLLMAFAFAGCVWAAVCSRADLMALSVGLAGCGDAIIFFLYLHHLNRERNKENHRALFSHSKNDSA